MNRQSWLALLLLTGCATHGPADRHGPEPGVNVADAALEGGMPQTALSVTNTILRSHPNDLGALVRQAQAQTQMNQLDAATDSYRRALAVDPASPAALLGLGRLDLGRGRAADAERSFTKLLIITPGDRTALNDLGVALDLQGRHAAAQASYRTLLGLVPDDQAASVNLALSLSLSGHAEQSVAMLRGPGSRPDALPRVRQDLAVALALSGARQEAEKLLLTDLSPADAEAAVKGYQALNATGQ